MRFSPFFRRAFRITRFRSDVARDIGDEIQFYIDMRVEELVQEGWDPAAAEKEALKAFGDRGRVEAECRTLSQEVDRRRRRTEWLGSLASDIKLVARDLRKRPAHFVSVSLTLALALSLATAVFTVVYGVVLKPLPFGQPDRVVALFNHYVKAGPERVNSSATEYRQRRDGMTSFEDVAIYTSQTRSIGEPGAISRTFSMYVSPSFFRVLGLRPALGRFLDDNQEQPGRRPQVVIGHKLWARLFASDPEIVGKTVPVEGQDHTIVGVMPEGFAFPGWDAGIWLPQVLDESAPPESWYYSMFEMVARLKPGVTVQQAQLELDALNVRTLGDLPTEIRAQKSQNAYRTVVVDFHADLTRNVRHWLFLLLAGSLFVLFIAAVSISNLQLVHVTGRLRELSTRYVLGAGRGRLMRQLMTESLVLAFVGGTLGIIAGSLSLRWWLANFQTWEIPRIDEVGLGATEVALLMTAAILAMLSAGLVGAGSAARPDLFAIMREGSSTEGGRGSRRRGFLVTLQIATSVVLLVGAVLMIVSLRNLLAIDLGFEESSVHAAALSLAEREEYGSRGAKSDFFRSLIDETTALPGVESVAIASRIPFSGWDETTALTPQGRTRSVDEVAAKHHRTVVSREYFQLMEVPLRQGRVFQAGDTLESLPVVVISEVLAAKYWPGENAVGQRICIGPAADDDSTWLTVVGVVAEIIQEDLTETPLGAYYLPMQQAARGFTRVLVKARPGFEGPLMSDLKRTVNRFNPDLALFWVTTLEQSVDSSLIAYRLPMQFLSIFAAIALALAAVGVFGVLSRSVALRSKEIGIRLALGSSRSQVFGSTLRHLSGFIAGGVVLGLATALGLSRWIESLVYGVEPTALWVFLSVAGLVSTISLLAAFVPALRAGRLDPVQALSAE